MRNLVLLPLVLGLLLSPSLTTAQIKADLSKVGSPKKISIDENGLVKADGLVVQQIAGSTFYVRAWWGELFLRMTVRTGVKTTMVKKFGGSIEAADIKVGDVLSAEGTLVPGSDRIDIDAIYVKNWSDQTDAENLMGTISENGSPTVLKKSDGSGVVLNFNSSSVIHKGNLTISPEKLQIGDRVTSAGGIYDHASKTMEVKEMRVYQNMSVFRAQNYQGVLKSKPGDNSFVLRIGEIDYTVRYGSNVTVYTKQKSPTSLNRFVEEDAVRVYGAKREAEPTVLDVEIIRNLNL